MFKALKIGSTDLNKKYFMYMQKKYFVCLCSSHFICRVEYILGNKIIYLKIYILFTEYHRNFISCKVVHFLSLLHLITLQALN